MVDRVQQCADLVNAEMNEPWVVWCELNVEGDELTKLIDGAVQISGSDTEEYKESTLAKFADGEIRVLVSKTKICGWGLNWQHAARMAFVGVTDSFESYYQAIRRCWRFGQKRPVHVHVFSADTEGAVVANLKRKEQDAKAMADALIAEVSESIKNEVLGTKKESNDYTPSKKIIMPSFLEAA
jgi:SNF2 family DNA or RNA helicase